MAEPTKTDLLLQAYKSVPAPVKAFIESDDFSKATDAIALKFNLSETVAAQVSNELLMLLLRIEEPDSLLDNLLEIEGMSEDTAVPLIEEVNREIFSKLSAAPQTEEPQKPAPAAPAPRPAPIAKRTEPEKDPEHLLEAPEGAAAAPAAPTPPKPVVPAAALNRSAPPKFAPRPQVRTMKTDVEAVKKPTIPAMPPKPVVPVRPTAAFVPFVGKPTPPPAQPAPAPAAPEVPKASSDPYREPIE